MLFEINVDSGSALGNTGSGKSQYSRDKVGPIGSGRSQYLVTFPDGFLGILKVELGVILVGI